MRLAPLLKQYGWANALNTVNVAETQKWLDAKMAESGSNTAKPNKAADFAQNKQLSSASVMSAGPLEE